LDFRRELRSFVPAMTSDDAPVFVNQHRNDKSECGDAVGQLSNLCF
jgi:hypothetical protein